MHCLKASHAIPTEFCQEMCNHLGVRVGRKLDPYFRQSVLQFGKIFDDAVMNNGYTIGKVRVSVAFCRCAMGRPSCVRNADGAAQGLFFNLVLRFTSLPSARRRCNSPSKIVATPAES